MVSIEKCKCWNRVRYEKWDEWRQIMLPYTRDECWGTKEREACSCGGDESKCDFYPYKCRQAEVDGRKDQMYTADMWIAAQTDGKTYIAQDMRYSKEKGFHDRDGTKWDPSAFKTIEQIMQCEWTVLKTMTRAEAERKYGIIIEG